MQKKLFELIQDKKKPLSGDQALEKAKQFKGKPEVMTFMIKYISEEELIQKLEKELERLRGPKKKRT